MKETWIVVADSARARFFSTDSPRGALRDVACLVHTESREHERDLASDKAGRMAGGHGEGAHGVGDEHHFREIEHHRFARKVAEFLATADERAAYDRLVICAPPRFLGAIRDALPASVATHVVLEIPKDLAHVTDTGELRTHLPERL